MSPHRKHRSIHDIVLDLPPLSTPTTSTLIHSNDDSINQIPVSPHIQEPFERWITYLTLQTSRPPSEIDTDSPLASPPLVYPGV